MVQGPARRVVLVTGGSQGIGRAIAEHFADAGDVVVAGSRTAQDFRSAGGQLVRGRSLDLTDPQSCRTLVEAVQTEFGSLDVLVNNAGIAEAVKFARMNEDLWRRHQRIDVDGPMWLIQAAIPLMLTRGYGRVISVASVAAQLGFSHVAAYVAAKHALLGLTRALAAEFVRTELTFNCVSPYYTDTQMAVTAADNTAARSGRTRAEALTDLHTPQGRLIAPGEVAGACGFLASHAARSITGQTIVIDGGLTAVR